MSQSFCIKCGSKQEINKQFCSTCGTEFKNEGQSKETQVQPRVVQERHQLLDASFFGVYTYGRTYLNILYLILLLPVGITLFVYAVTCFSTFVGLIPIVVGFFLLYFFLISLPYLMNVQSWLTKIQCKKYTFPKKEQQQKKPRHL
ncbi:MAG: sensor domain-containing protein [Candidatus Heimdallarchaeota archaeon]